MSRLLSLNSYHYRRGGSDVVYFEHTEAFAQLGWDTAYFAMHHPKNETSPWSEYFSEEIEFGHQYGVMGSLRRAKDIIYSSGAKKKMEELIQSFSPTVAHAHCIYHHLSPSVLYALKEAGVPTVMTAHDLKLACPAYKMMTNGSVCEKCKGGNYRHVVSNRCVRDSLAASTLVYMESTIHHMFDMYEKNLDRIVAPSEFFAEKLTQWGLDRKKIRVIPNYVDVDPNEQIERGGDYILYFGRLAPEKGIDTLIRASAASKVKVIIAGTGPDEESLRQLACELDAPVEFAGHISGPKMTAALQGSLATVLPSRWYENAPMSVLESYGAGRIVIGSRIGGIPELVTDGDTGFLCEPNDVDSLTECMVKVQTMSSSRLHAMQNSARDWVNQQRTKEQYIESTSALYKELV